MINKLDKNADRVIRHQRVRKSISGTASRPILCVYRSLTHIYAQIINDELGVTLASSSTLESNLKELLQDKNKSEQAYIIGEDIAKKALEKGIDTIVFDRGGYIYTGRVAKVAEGARNGGLKF
ncbi:MAG: 50S ribosomal protein L18 [Clostridia bacterium]|nr:50S ribosomal protein L18 [Clostridia bacterium]